MERDIYYYMIYYDEVVLYACMYVHGVSWDLENCEIAAMFKIQHRNFEYTRGRGYYSIFLPEVQQQY